MVEVEEEEEVERNGEGQGEEEQGLFLIRKENVYEVVDRSKNNFKSISTTFQTCTKILKPSMLTSSEHSESRMEG